MQTLFSDSILEMMMITIKELRVIIAILMARKEVEVKGEDHKNIDQLKSIVSSQLLSLL